MRSRFRTGPVGWLLFLLWLTACSRYELRQTALVPPAVLAPPVSAERGLDVSATGSYTTGLGAGRASSDDSPSVWISRANLTSAVEMSGRRVGGRLLLFHGLNQGAERATQNNVGRPKGMVWGFGPSLVLRALADHPKHRLTVDLGTLFVVAPSRVRAECLDCETVTNDASGYYDDVSVALMLTGGLQHRVLVTEDLRLWWGSSLQTLATNSYRVERDLPGRSKIRMGAVHPTLMAGVEWLASRWVSVQPGVAWIAPPSPAWYYPTAMIAVRFHAFDDERQKTEPEDTTGLRVLDQDLATLRDTMRSAASQLAPGPRDTPL